MWHPTACSINCGQLPPPIYPAPLSCNLWQSVKLFCDWPNGYRKWRGRSTKVGQLKQISQLPRQQQQQQLRRQQAAGCKLPTINHFKQMRQKNGQNKRKLQKSRYLNVDAIANLNKL